MLDVNGHYYMSVCVYRYTYLGIYIYTHTKKLITVLEQESALQCSPNSGDMVHMWVRHTEMFWCFLDASVI